MFQLNQGRMGLVGGQRFSPAKLFAGGINGAWYDPSDSTTLFADRAGTTPCAAPGAGALVPVGLMLDKRVPVAQTGYYSGYFNGSATLSGIGTVSSFNFMHNTTALFTCEFWVYNTAIALQQVFVDTCGGTSANVGFYIGLLAGGTITCAIVNGSSAIVNGSSSSTIAQNILTHVAITYDQSLGSANLKFYINGVAAGTTNKTAATPSSSDAKYSLRIGGTNPSGNLTYGNISNLRITNNIVYSGAFIPPTTPLAAISGTQLLTCQNSTFIDNSSNAYTITNNSAKTSAFNPFGNHAIAANDTTARPELSARVNLLTYTEQFDNAAWVKSSVTISKDVVVAPDGTTTADLIYPNTNGTFRWVYQVLTASSAIYTRSIYAKAQNKSIIYIDPLGTGSAFAYFNLSNGTVGTVSAGYTATITAAGNGWYRCTMTNTVAGATSFGGVYGVADADGSTSVTANGTDGIYIWGAQLIATNIGSTIPAYQRVADQYTYDNVGFPRYLAFNGTSSAMSTPANVNLSGTDKVTVFAGVRKLSGTAQIISEFSADTQTNAGSFVLGSAFVSATSYDVQVRGSARNARYYETYTAPISNVLSSAITTAAADSASAMQTRVNGTVNAGTSFLSVTSTGNFGSYPLFIGARNNGTIAFLNGNIYSLIVAGSAVSAGNITATEQWVAGKTGITI